MVKKTNPDSSWTGYTGGIYEVTNTGAVTKYYRALGRMVAMRSGGTLSYLLADHLGSTVGLVDTSGNLVANSKTAYWPYGARRSGAITPTDKLYTGQQQEPGDTLGLYNYKARFYSTVTGRFVSADPVANDGLNRYAYVRHNPLRWIDPSGLACSSNGRTPCPEVAPTPSPDADRYGTPVPGVDLGSWNACNDNPAGCLMWAAGGDWSQYVTLVADRFDIPSGILAAIILNEMDSRSWSDPWKEGLAETLGIECVSRYCVSYGIAQVQLRSARHLEESDMVPSAGSQANRIARLKDPKWAIYYAAGYLSDVRHTYIAAEGRLGTDYSNDLIILYFAAPKVYQAWARNGANPNGGETTGPQLRKVQPYLPGAVEALAVRLSH